MHSTTMIYWARCSPSFYLRPSVLQHWFPLKLESLHHDATHSNNASHSDFLDIQQNTQTTTFTRLHFPTGSNRLYLPPLTLSPTPPCTPSSPLSRQHLVLLTFVAQPSATLRLHSSSVSSQHSSPYSYFLYTTYRNPLIQYALIQHTPHHSPSNEHKNILTLHIYHYCTNNALSSMYTNSMCTLMSFSLILQ